MRLPCAKNCPRRANRLLSSKIKFVEVDLRKDWFEAALRRALVHRCKVARSVVHRFSADPHVSGRRPHTA